MPKVRHFHFASEDVPGLESSKDFSLTLKLLCADVEASEEDYGLYLWPSAILLAHYIWRHPIDFATTIVELGCGCGLSGLVAAAVGGRVTLTDKVEYKHVLDNLHTSCQMNHEVRSMLPLNLPKAPQQFAIGKGIVTIQGLTWGRFCASSPLGREWLF